MHEEMILLEKDEKIPAKIIEWAELHSVPIEFCPDTPGTDRLNATVPDTEFRYDYVITYSSDITPEYLDILYCHSHDLSAMIGASERIIIREIAPEDLDSYKELIELFPDAVSDNTLSGLSKEEFRQRHLAYIKYSYHFLGYGIYGIFLRKSGKMIGIAGVDGTDRPALSYALFNEHQGKGYAYDACRIILDHMEKYHSMAHIDIIVKKSNTASLNLAKKLGDAFPGLIRLNIIE
jgi:RimJ/RimL family protein N-acetyltransferase